MTPEEIAEEHHLSTQRGWRAKKAWLAKREVPADYPKNVAVPVPVWEEAKRAHRAGYQTLTAYLMRDPLPGRSALDLRNQHA